VEREGKVMLKLAAGPAWGGSGAEVQHLVGGGEL
jgi:hypothetical protein